MKRIGTFRAAVANQTTERPRVSSLSGRQIAAGDTFRNTGPNLHAPFYLAKAVAPIMKAQGWGRIVSVGSGAGRSHSRSKIVPYAAAKAGLHGLMRQLAVELAPSGVNCNIVAPGLILSERGREDWERRDPAQKEKELVTIAIDRLGAPEEVANVIAFVVSDEASYLIGQTIMVDGGHWMF